ncbi:MAG: hydrogenase nickel incorporation protein HypB [Solidesulfovibrio sp.]|uniref:hydrogenase nickel incorporation protein HypB n=1 Tax=Solidesulfovibrio sp. TaxID=2910990 RepID=UPI002B20394F|nr:hydrogenase nickel incorporation protein HypB [Solidesulfovibrio sp.]MEA4858338.1 hydrogenase nickel incorporation protein HypB [Solidesulfovibrio sp.]
MKDIPLIDLRREIFADNDACASDIRRFLRDKRICMFNLMGSPGCGKTSLLLQTIRRLKGKNIAVIEGDLDSMVDSEKIMRAGADVIQVNTGGACHLDAVVVQRALHVLSPGQYDAIFVENIGNLVCPAEFDIGENKKIMMLSVPEGDDKILKYPLMFTVADVLIIHKTDCLPDDGFSMQKFRACAALLNPHLQIFEVSSRTGNGIGAWTRYLEKLLEAPLG